LRRAFVGFQSLLLKGVAWTMIRKVLIGLSIIIGVIILSLVGYLGIIYAGNYAVDEKDLVMDSATTLVDQDDNVISKLYSENRELVSIDDIPEHVQQAFVSIEDERFYDHHGLDVRAISRALYKDILAGSKVEGGSTITQQLAKNVFLSNDKTWLRKTKEAVIAINLERNYSKKKILEMYLNQIYYGHGAYGIQAASTLFFNKDVSELTVEEGALLAALPKAPSHYSPIDHPEESKKRRDLVLSLMEENDFLSAEEAVRAQGKTLALEIHRLEKNPAYLTYIDMVIEEAGEKYSLSPSEVLKGGYKIVVPMNQAAQEASFEAFQQDDYFRGSDPENSPQGSFVLLESKSGGVMAVQGGRDYVTQGLNRVRAKGRQPGSTYKPLAVYGPALETGDYEPYSLLRDEKLDYNGYQPGNYDKKYRGQVTMYDAIKDSINAPAVWLLNEIGISTSKKYLKQMGMDIKDKGLGIALGGIDEGITPMEMAKAYRTLAHNGEVIDPYFISEIYDRNGNLVAEAEPEEHRVFSSQTAWYMTRMLQAVVESGTGKAGEVNTELAGKTGTTSFEEVDGANKDVWFAGYTPEAVGVVWIGYDQTTKERYLTGSSGDPTRLFKAVINKIPDQENLTFEKPDDVEELEPPIRLITIDDLKAEFALGNFGLPSVRLTWTPSEDKRLMYKVFIETDEGAEKVDTVVGEGEYTVTSTKLLQLPKFYVVPHNPQTEQDGEPSNIIELELWDGMFEKEKKEPGPPHNGNNGNRGKGRGNPFAR
jgi:penicillin-binding protein 2A